MGYEYDCFVIGSNKQQAMKLVVRSIKSIRYCTYVCDGFVVLFLTEMMGFNPSSPPANTATNKRPPREDTEWVENVTSRGKDGILEPNENFCEQFRNSD